MFKFYNKHSCETLIVVTGDDECGGLTPGYAGTEYETAFDVLDGQTVSYEYFDKYVREPFKERNTLASANTRELLPVLEQYFGLKDFSGYELSLIENAFQQTMMDKSGQEGTLG